jgi:proteasome lid subunit RPN8/RPN11
MTNTSALAPVEVLFSRRAHAAICAETLEHHPNETGGILLGHFHQNRWQVLEAIDPGPAARCTAPTFEYDLAYVNHLAAKQARLYCRPLQLIGLWHRHPGSFDRFSAEDDTTNRRFAQQSPDGALSCLINLDPNFRISAYHVSADLTYRQLPWWRGNELLDSELFALNDGSALDPQLLAERVLALDLQRLFERNPRPAAALQAPLLAALDPVLNQLEQQQRWGYGLRACGSYLQLALVEHQGPGRQLWELQFAADGSLAARRQGFGWLRRDQFLVGVLEGCSHAE